MSPRQLAQSARCQSFLQTHWSRLFVQKFHSLPQSQGSAYTFSRMNIGVWGRGGNKHFQSNCVQYVTSILYIHSFNPSYDTSNAYIFSLYRKKTKKQNLPNNIAHVIKCYLQRRNLFSDKNKKVLSSSQNLRADHHPLVHEEDNSSSSDERAPTKIYHDFPNTNQIEFLWVPPTSRAGKKEQKAEGDGLPDR